MYTYSLPVCLSPSLSCLPFAVEDQERNNGFDKPYFMSKKMQKLLNVHNRVEGPDGGDNGNGNNVSMENLTRS